MSQFYDQRLAPHGLTLNKHALPGRLAALGPTPINEVARDLVMHRTTLPRNVKPLQASGLVAQVPHAAERRNQCLLLTPQGNNLLMQATPVWLAAQSDFERELGSTQAAALRQRLHTVMQKIFASSGRELGSIKKGGAAAVTKLLNIT